MLNDECAGLPALVVLFCYHCLCQNLHSIEQLFLHTGSKTAPPQSVCGHLNMCLPGT